MSAASNHLEQLLLNHFRGTQLTLPADFYVALHTADPTDSATATEIDNSSNWTNYARQSLKAGDTLANAWDAPTTETGGGYMIANANDITFAAHNGDTAVTVTHFSLWDSLSGGNMWVHAPLTANKTIDPTDIFSAIAGSLRLIVR